MKPTASVVIPLYNKAPYITATLESVLEQTRTDFEIIVVDDGSTDESAERVRPYRDRIHYDRQENQGPSRARNRGIELATGKYVAFLDADDRWLPTKLEAQIEFLDDHPDIMWCATNYWIALPGRPSPTPGRVGAEAANWQIAPDWFEASLRREHSFMTSTLMVQKSALDRVGGFDEEIPAGQDTDLIWRIARAYPRSGFCTLPLLEYIQGVPGGISSGGPERYESISRFVLRHARLALQDDASDSYRRYVRSQCIYHVEKCIARGHPQAVSELVEQVPRDWVSPRLRGMLGIASLTPGTVRRLADIRLSVKRSLSPSNPGAQLGVSAGNPVNSDA